MYFQTPNPRDPRNCLNCYRTIPTEEALAWAAADEAIGPCPSHDFCDCPPEPKRHGYKPTGDAGGWVWAVYDRDTRDEMPVDYEDAQWNQLAQQLLGSGSYNGPGRWFSEKPMVRLGRSRVLIQQFVGQDI